MRDYDQEDTLWDDREAEIKASGIYDDPIDDEEEITIEEVEEEEV